MWVQIPPDPLTFKELIMLTEECLKRLPIGCFIAFTKTKDMDGIVRESVIWAFGGRKGAFCIKTGEYLGDVAW